MVIAPQTMLGTAALLVAVFVLGFWLRRFGKPYSGLVMTVHKLVSLAALILFILAVYQIHKATPLETSALAAAVLTVVFFVAAIISGGLISIDKALPPAVKVLHRVSPFLSLLAIAVTLYLLP